MKENPKTLQSDDLLDTAIFFMANGGYRHIPIVDDRYQPIGMVSVLDIMTYLVEHFPQEILTLPPRPIRDAMKAREGA
jgi:CBS domain-containing protein